MRPQELSAALEVALRVGQPVFVWGPPGVGKSSLMRQAAAQMGLQLIDIRCVLLDAADMRGLPYVKGEVAHWARPAFLPTDGEGLLFFDEMSNAIPEVQSACLQLWLDRQLGEYHLPNGWKIAAAGNRVQDRAGVHRLISSLSNRVLHLDLDVSNVDWQEWAEAAEIDPLVRGYLRFKPGALMTFDAAKGERAFPTPRSWTFVSRVLKGAPLHLRFALVAGCVGEGTAAEFCAYCRVAEQVPTPEEVFRNPDQAPVPLGQPDLLHAVVLALSAYLKDVSRAGPDVLRAYVRYARRLPDEFGVFAARDALAARPNFLVAAPGAGDWLRELRKTGVFSIA